MIDQTQPVTPIAQPIIQPVKKRSPLLLVIMFILLLVIFGVITFFSTQRKTLSPIRPNKVSSTIPTVTPRPILGSMTISSSGGVRFPKSSPITLQIQASSQGRQVVGYGVVVTYDKSGFDFVKATSLMDNFKIYSYDRQTYVSLSAMKSLQDNTSTSWNNQSLSEITFQPKKTGTYIFSLTAVGKEASKLVDEKVEVIYPSVGQLELEVY